VKYIIIINAVLEGLAGIILLLRPEWLLLADTPQLHGIVVSKLYGVAALTMGIFSWIVSKNFEYTPMYKSFILMIILFHMMVGFQMYAVYEQGITRNPGAFILHLLLALAFGLVYLKNMQKFRA
jgi:hypothetical protein